MASEIAIGAFRRISMSYVAKKIIEQAKEFEECLEEGVPRDECERRVYYGIYNLFGIIPISPPCGGRSDEVRRKIFETPKNAMIFSEHIEEAFKKTGINLKDDETYACIVCVTKRPTHVSQVITPATTSLEMQEQPRVDYIMEPRIMRRVIEVMEQDKIKY